MRRAWVGNDGGLKDCLACFAGRVVVANNGGGGGSGGGGGGGGGLADDDAALGDPLGDPFGVAFGATFGEVLGETFGEGLGDVLDGGAGESIGLNNPEGGGCRESDCVGSGGDRRGGKAMRKRL